MRRSVVMVFIFTTFFFSKSALSGLISVEYAVDFNSYSNNESSFYITPSGFDGQVEQDEYLVPDNFFVTVLYDTNRAGGIFNSETGELVRNSGTWAEIIDSNINVSNSHSINTFNSLITATRDKGRDIYSLTTVSGSLNIAFDVDSIDELDVGDSSIFFDFYKYLSGEYLGLGGDMIKAYNQYSGVATVNRITTVPEPSSIMLLSLCFIGLFVRKNLR